MIRWEGFDYKTVGGRLRATNFKTYKGSRASALLHLLAEYDGHKKSELLT